MTKRRLSDGEVIGALMAARTKGEAAELLGVSRQTVYNYMNDSGFAAKLDEAVEERERVIEAARMSATARAIELLSEIMDADTDWLSFSGVSKSDQIEAARVLLTSPAAMLERK